MRRVLVFALIAAAATLPRPAVGAKTDALVTGLVPPIASLHYETKDQLIFLPVRVDGSPPLRFVLDSGARHSIVDSTAAAALGLAVIATDRTSGAGQGTVGRQHVAPIDFRIGEVPLHVDDPWLIDLAGAARAGGYASMDGLIGAEFFQRYVVRLDPVARTLAVFEAATFRANPAEIVMPLTLDQERLYLDLTLVVGHERETHRIRIDTGSGDAVSDDIVRRSSERRQVRQGVGLGTSYVGESGVIDTVWVGPYAIARSWGASNAHPAVGMEILRRFTMTFDVPRRRLYLAPNRHLHDPVPAPPG